MEVRGDGWIPVFRRKARVSRRSQDIHTVFVDNLPETLDPKGLFSLFSKFGVVMDVYIPIKRRKATSSRFGFVRYNCPVAAKVAIQKAHGTWCDNHEIKVKMAEFSKAQSKHGQQRVLQRGVGNTTHRNHVSMPSIRNTVQSYADVVTGTRTATDEMIVVKAEEYGNRWLHESLVAKLKPLCLVSDFRIEVTSRYGLDAHVREIGGKSVILSFKSEEVMNSVRKELELWTHEWCEFITHWTKDTVIEHEREVWISCYGVPLNLWNSTNFKSIGMLWSDVIAIDRSTLEMSHLCCGKVKIATKVMECINQVITLDCKGTLHQIRVCEEQVVVIENPSFSNIHMQEATSVNASRGDEHSVDNGVILRKEDDEVVMNDEVEPVRNSGGGVCIQGALKEKELSGNDSLMAISVIKETARDLEKTSIGDACLRNETTMSDNNVLVADCENRLVDGLISTPGFVKSISGSDLPQPSVNLEVFLGPVQFVQSNLTMPLIVHGPNKVDLIGCADPTNSGLHYSRAMDTLSQPRDVIIRADPSDSGLHQPVAAAPLLQSSLKGGTSKATKVSRYHSGPKPNPSKTPKKSKAKANGGARFNKGVLLRAATKALSDSISLSSSSGKGRSLLNEAQATLQIGNLLGINCEGKEAEVIEKIMELETQDLERRKQLDAAK
ncbi:hypothetical protein CsSME_00020715 [Camellia sinensis var. sinensis]